MSHKKVKNKLAGAVETASNPVVDKKYADQERKYKAEDALRTLQRAEEIKRDKGLMKDAKACAREQIKALSKVK